jgi:RNA polymerase primary sigma factor
MLRFGFEDGLSWTLKQLGHDFGVTPERVRQMEAKLLRLLRAGKRSRYLELFIKEEPSSGA